MTPTQSCSYLVNQRRRNAELRTHFGQRPTEFAKNKKLGDIFIPKFGRRMGIAFRYSPTRQILQPGIFRPANPSKIRRKIVASITVNVIDGSPLEPSINKGSRHKPMDALAMNSSVSFDNYSGIGAAHIRLKQYSLANLSRLPDPFRGRFVIQRPDASLIGDFKFNAFCGLNALPSFHGLPLRELQGRCKRRAAEAALYSQGTPG